MATHRTPKPYLEVGPGAARFPAVVSVLMIGAGLAFLVAGLGAIAGKVPPVRSATAPAAAVSWSDLLAEGAVQPVASAAAPAPEQRILAEFLAKRFRVAQDAAGSYVAAAYRAGSAHRVDPLLVLAVAAVESRFNPVAESALGAKGLMQVLPKYHQEKLLEHGGDAALLDPLVNIEVGTRILREYVRRAGSLEAGLQLYGGTGDEASSPYAGKVLGERARLEQLLARHRRATV